MIRHTEQAAERKSIYRKAIVRYFHVLPKVKKFFSAAIISGVFIQKLSDKHPPSTEIKELKK